MADIELKVTKKKPIRGIPMYGDWLKVLLARGVAKMVTAIDRDTRKPIIDGKTGLPKKTIQPFDQHQEQPTLIGDDHDTRILCIGCGLPARRMEMSKIRIGGLIQIPSVEQIAPNEIENGWKVQPTSKTGLGCRVCAAKMASLEQKMAQENADRRAYATLCAEQASLLNQIEQLQKPKPLLSAEKCKHGVQERFCAVCVRDKGYKAPIAHTITSKADRVAFIDVFEDRSRF